MTRSDDACTQLADAVQAMLDGATAALPAELEAHRHECASCRSLWTAGERLRAGLAEIRRAPLESELTQRLTAAVIADRTTASSRFRRYQRIVTWVSAAAAGLIGIVLATELVARMRPSLKMTAMVHPRITPAEKKREAGSLDMRENLASASDALLSLTRRTTEDAIEPTKDLLSLDFAARWLKPPDGLPIVADPAGQSLDEVRQGAAAGFEPMATSARRAFAMFTRDLPVDRAAKPGS